MGFNHRFDQMSTNLDHFGPAAQMSFLGSNCAGTLSKYNTGTAEDDGLDSTGDDLLCPPATVSSVSTNGNSAAEKLARLNDDDDGRQFVQPAKRRRVESESIVTASDAAELRKKLKDHEQQVSSLRVELSALRATIKKTTNHSVLKRLNKRKRAPLSAPVATQSRLNKKSRPGHKVAGLVSTGLVSPEGTITPYSARPSSASRGSRRVGTSSTSKTLESPLSATVQTGEEDGDEDFYCPGDESELDVDAIYEAELAKARGGVADSATSCTPSAKKRKRRTDQTEQTPCAANRYRLPNRGKDKKGYIVYVPMRDTVACLAAPTNASKVRQTASLWAATKAKLQHGSSTVVKMYPETPSNLMICANSYNVTADKVLRNPYVLRGLLCGWSLVPLDKLTEAAKRTGNECPADFNALASEPWFLAGQPLHLASLNRLCIKLDGLSGSELETMKAARDIVEALYQTSQRNRPLFDLSTMQDKVISNQKAFMQYLGLSPSYPNRRRPNGGNSGFFTQ